MNYADTKAALNAKRAQIAGIRQEMRTLQGQVEPELIPDYELAGWEGPVRLSALFGDKPNLLLIHNMGRSCSSCTMWADGFNGVYDHLASRASFVVSSPDPVDIQKDFAGARGWRFPMVSHAGSSFAKDLGYWNESDGWWPGVSALRKEGERIWRLSDTDLGPLDDFCVYYHLMELFPGGDPQFTPKYSYA